MSFMIEVILEGQLKFIIKDIFVKSLDGVLKVIQLCIYYGEKIDLYVIVNIKIDEIDYLEGDLNKFYRYIGNGGIKFILFNRLIFLYVYKDFRFFVFFVINLNSKIFINRNIV